MQIAVIGLGNIARKAYLPILGNLQGLDILPSSRSETATREIQAQYRLPRGAADLAEVIHQRPQAAFVLTPKETHFEIVRQLLEADIDVFVEKPATLHSADTRALAELAERRSRVLMVGFNRRFAPLHIRARELMGNRRISLGVFEKHRAAGSNTDLAEHIVQDTIHQIDLLRFYCGEGKVISTSCQTQQGNVLSASSMVALENGGTAILATCLRAGAWQERYSLHGSNQSILIDAFERLRLVSTNEERTWRENYASKWKTNLEGRGFTGQIDHFLACVLKREQPQTSGHDSVRTQQLVEDMIAKVNKKDLD